MLSKSCIYGIQAAIYVAANASQEFVPISQIASELKISFHFLTKVLQQLTQARLMNSYRGPKGGVALAKPSTEVTLYDLIGAIDGTAIFTECMLGLPGCGIAEPCPAHEHWTKVRSELTVIARRLTLDSMAKKAGELNVRLTEEFRYAQTMFPAIRPLNGNH
ncbi:MAG: Rrf2 family transcriptional regulator [Candidatus Kapabacteria bacterium]|nr:Rrf2 family transcriptional regulator [Candidatus Kapabacteria bacterium]